MRLRLSLVMCIIALPGAALAQAAGSDPGAGAARSTRSGVYSARQAEKGNELYALSCVSCHTAASHTGPAFAAKWNGRELLELFQYISTEMPKQDPGSLSAGEYTLALAYILKINGMPPGKDELPSEPAALQKIRIDLTRDSSPR